MDLVKRDPNEPARQVHDAELVDDPPPAPLARREPVDTTDPPRTIYATVTSWQDAEERPILPAWIRSTEQRWLVVQLVARRIGRRIAYHLVRIPMYTLLSLWWAPRGGHRLARGGVGLLFDAEARPLRQHTIDRNDTETWMKLDKLRSKKVRARTPAAAAAAVGVLVVVCILLGWPTVETSTDPNLSAIRPLWPAQLRLGVLVAVVAVLGRIGQPADKPIVRSAFVNNQQAEKPTSEIVERALRSVGIGAMSAKDAKIGFPHPIRTDGPGWRADVDLPLGVTALDVMERRMPLASGLRRPVGCVWPEPDPDTHAGRLVLWVGMQDMAKARQKPWPLRRTGVADYFGALPFGTDQRGRGVGLPLAESNMLIGSLPGAGKTASLRCVLLGCALDPTVELHIWELKGSGDLESFERVAHAYGSGVDDDTIERCLGGLRWLLAEVGRRAERLRLLRTSARDLVPDSKVTREVANRRRLGLHPIVFAVDECQELFSHPDFGRQAGEAATAVIKRGRALGVTLILATQRPDKDSLPTGISANVGTRYCLRVMGQIENDMVLGTSAYKQGIRATTFTRSDRGIGYLVGASDAPMVVRSYYLDAAAADSVVARAYLARERAGLLTGQAAGETVEAGEVVDVLEDVRRALGGAERMWTTDLLVRLGEHRPHLYGGWTEKQLALALKPYGVAPGPLKIDGVNRNGYRDEDVVEGLQRRQVGGSEG
ncbi:MAG: cell division protein FtsK [Pseudonocardia sp.]|nr:cell division protein FtsK [Pseudonocardia sp.]